MKIKDLIEILQEMNPEETVAFSLWSKEDVFEICECSEEEAYDILDNVEDGFDACEGMTWDSLMIVAEELGFELKD